MKTPLRTFLDAPARRRRHSLAGQSLTVVIVVMFLLLFVGGLFIALVVNNLRDARDAAKRSSADKYAEAGLKYLDEQLLRSPEGADWRPVPDDLPGDQNTAADPYDPVNDIDPRDPDYDWLRESNPGRDGYDAAGNPLDFGPYTRVTFGGPTPSAGNNGGRALVRISYRPYDPAAGPVDDPRAERKYLRLDAIGRVGSIDPADPTTYSNTEDKSLRRELTARKAIGLTDYLRFVTNKENRSVEAALGAPNLVVDAPAASAGGRQPVAPTPREIVSVFDGPMRFNTGLAFYGVNVLNLDARRNDALEVSGGIRLDRVAGDTTAPTPTDPTRVYVNGPGTGVPNLLPSGSSRFDTLDGLIRDNPAGPDTRSLPSTTDRNLRTVGCSPRR
ncbi:MAG: hypothetical protein ACKO5K_14660 [Armatimonadota bacterium]